MKNRVMSLVAMFTLLVGTVLAQKPAYQLRGDVNYESQVVRVKFKAEQTQQLDAMMLDQKGGTLTARGGHLSLGMAGFDAASASVGATSMKRVFRPAGKFEARHRQYGLHLWYEVEFSGNMDLQQAINQFGGAAEVIIVEPKEQYRLVDGYDATAEAAAAVNNFSPETISGGTPNDPSYNQQWGFPAIDAAQAWELETGHDAVVVAIEDQGVDYNHPDLAGNMWTNTGEIPNNGVDDDNNGYVDDYYGYNFGNDNGNIAIDYHGTHVGGTVAAETNNGVGVAGTAGGSGNDDGVRLMSLSVFGSGAQAGFDEAFIYAADMGAAISQNSWGGGAQSSAMENAIDYFRANGGGNVMNGGLVVFAAGNDNSSSASSGYPGSYESCLSVASLASNLSRSSFSNYGSWVDISAPGSSIYSTYPVSQGSYNSISGTSMACPHVSGVAALVVSNKYRNGEIITDDELWGILTGNTTNVDAQNGSYIGQLGSGLVNAYSALTGEAPPPPPPPPCYEGTGDVTLTLVTDNYASETSWTLKDENGTTIASNGALANNTTYTETFTGLVGRHTFTINDSYGDGICCSYGNGSYQLVDAEGTVLASGGSFGSSAATDICMNEGNPPSNTAPVANAGGPYSGDEGSAIAFDASGSTDADGDALTYSWNFGDGNTGSGATTSHVYTTAGTYTATVTVSDGTDSDQASATVTVNAVVVNTPPVANAGGPYSGDVNSVIAFDGSGSTDADGDALIYSWDFGDGNSGSGSTVSHIYTTAGTYTATLTVTDGEANDQATAAVTVNAVGGPDCPTAVTLTLNTDDYATETSWDVKDAAGNVVASNDGLLTDFTTYTETFGFADGDYTFTIYDSYGDGICCTYGNGSYTLTDQDGNLLASGGDFASNEATDFCLSGGGSGGGGGGACSDAAPTAYCANSGGGSLEWIDLVDFAGINNVTNTNNGGYSDHTDMTGNVAPGGSYAITLSAGFASSLYSENWAVYIDYNQDGDFDDAGEEAATGSSTGSGNISGTIDIPTTAREGNTRMRVVMWWNNTPAACGSVSYGETEDYTLNVCTSNPATVSNYQLFSGVDMGDVTVVDRMSLYPNPATDRLSIDVLRLEGEAEVMVTDLQGRVMITRDHFTGGSIHVGGLSNGMYLLQVRTEDGLLISDTFQKQ